MGRHIKISRCVLFFALYKVSCVLRIRYFALQSSGFFNGFSFLFLSHSSSGLGHRPFTAVTGVRTPYGTPLLKLILFNDKIDKQLTDLRE